MAAKRAADAMEGRPKTQAVVQGGRQLVSKASSAVGTGARRVVDAVPDGIVDWSVTAAKSARDSTARLSRLGLSPQRVVRRHQQRGHDVARLADVRKLDLEQVDSVKGRAVAWAYPAVAAFSGAGAAFVISGSEIVVPATAGAAAAPSGTAIAVAFTADAAAVLAMSSRSVGHIALLYGYDPEEPAEKLFVMSVINVGTATSQAAKAAAFSDLSRLTQALVRGSSWQILNKSLISKASARFAQQMGIRLTKKGLGKAVPAVGIALGGAFNWATLESVVDAADTAYRRRFLLDKYPQLDRADAFPFDADADGEEGLDEVISIDEISELAGDEESSRPEAPSK
ncbi:EcsC family protein [Rathayibacter sp. VKM Ac-2801]|uniref:EcsC family protein n=1 Tax=Rathayibacter sp. VKM Ac-2801 TaxID=2609255 RepID=UPI001ABEAE0D